MLSKLAAATTLIAASHTAVLAQPAAQVASPDGSIVVSVDTDNDKRVRYPVTRRGKPLIAPSLLGFALTDSYPMQRGFVFQGSETASNDTSWEQPWGERRFVRSHYNELPVRFKQPAYLQRAMNIRFRVFDNGIGLRYELPEQPGLKTMRIAEEFTEFDVAQDGKAWWITGGDWNRYEQIYQATPIDAVATAHTPITMRPRELDFISRVPADWSESRLIAGEVGDYALFARKDRNSDDWYVGGVNDATPRTLDVNFDFLDPGRSYTATIYRDGKGATYETDARHNIAIVTRKVKRGDTLSLWLAPGGGAAIRLAAARQGR